MDTNEENTQDNLEQKISDAELDAQKQETPPQEEAGSSFESEVVESGEEEESSSKKGLSKARRIWRRLLVWLVVVAIAFAGGFYLDAQMRYLPEIQRTDSLKAELDDNAAEIASLQAEIDRLSQFEEQNTNLTEEVNRLETYLTLLTARTGVAEAALAVAQDRTADARLALDKVGSSLETLKGMVNTDQAEVIDSMLQRHKLVLIELENDGYSVQTDLELLANRLVTLENNLFASP